MQLPDSYRARDQRTALYLDQTQLFIQRLKAEITLHQAEAAQYNIRPAVRLNGSSDILWERFHTGLFREFQDIQFFDYTKLRPRMMQFLGNGKKRNNWPRNYHLTFSADQTNHVAAKRILDSVGNVAVVFWPEIPPTCWGFPVIDGEEHDARFLDPMGTVVGLKAKGLARVDLSGFVIRPCPKCEPSRELVLVSTSDDSHRHTLHQCEACGFQLPARWKLTAVKPKNPLRRREAVTRQLPLCLSSAA